MKSNVIINILLLFNVHLIAQIVYIPDANFKTALFNYTPVIDTNSDGEIHVNEAAAVYTLDVSSSNIQDMTGIECFTNLTSLNFYHNQVSSIDLSNNGSLNYLNCSQNNLDTLNIDSLVNLTQLFCYENQLTNINLSKNINLIDLFCYENSLTTLNVNNNTLLDQLVCNDNYLTTLDVSSNLVIRHIVCYRNQISDFDVSNNINLINLRFYNNLVSAIDLSNNIHLTHLVCHTNLLMSLDLQYNTELVYLQCGLNNLETLNVKNGNNINMTNYFSLHNPLLFCIEVDDPVYSAAHWGQVDAWSTFNLNCTTNTKNNITNNNSNVFPNPTTGKFKVGLNEFDKIEILDVNGQVVIETDDDEIDINSFPRGVYYVKISMEKKTIIEEIVKK